MATTLVAPTVTLTPSQGIATQPAIGYSPLDYPASVPPLLNPPAPSMVAGIPDWLTIGAVVAGVGYLLMHHKSSPAMAV
jgi:hypothetical protein